MILTCVGRSLTYLMSLCALVLSVFSVPTNARGDSPLQTVGGGGKQRRISFSDENSNASSLAQAAQQAVLNSSSNGGAINGERVFMGSNPASPASGALRKTLSSSANATTTNATASNNSSNPSNSVGTSNKGLLQQFAPSDAHKAALKLSPVRTNSLRASNSGSSSSRYVSKPLHAHIIVLFLVHVTVHSLGCGCYCI